MKSFIWLFVVTIIIVVASFCFLNNKIDNISKEEISIVDSSFSDATEFASFSLEKISSAQMLGDFNMDGIVNLKDVSAMAKTYTAMKNGDLNSDGIIDTVDMRMCIDIIYHNIEP